MKRASLVALVLLAGLCWAARRPAEAWGSDLESAISRGGTVVALIAAPDRPLGETARDALDEAWRELRPRAERVALAECSPRIGRASALVLFVFAPGGELVARRDGPLDAELAKEWLSVALAAASSAAPRARDAQAGGEALFAHAKLALRLGDIERAERELLVLSASAPAQLRAAAHERLARLEIERGNVRAAREHLALATSTDSAATGRLLLTRGLIEFAEREHRAACATLQDAIRALEAAGDEEHDRARFEFARARAASGEASAAIALLEQLGRSGCAHSIRDAARRLADELCSSTNSH